MLFVPETVLERRIKVYISNGFTCFRRVAAYYLYRRRFPSRLESASRGRDYDDDEAYIARAFPSKLLFNWLL